MKTLSLLGGYLVTTLAVMAAAPATAHAQVGPPGRSFGLGVAVGYPALGLSGQYFMSQGRSIQFAASFWYRYGYATNFCNHCRVGGVFLRGDYLFHPNVFARGSVASLGWYIGPGVHVGLSGDVQAFGVEGALGLSLRFQRVPVDLAVEFVPQLSFLRYSGDRDGLYFGQNGTFHARYYF